MTPVEPTLKERASYMYRLLVLLQQLFQVSRQMEDVDWLATGSNNRDLALCTGVRELLEDLATHAQILTSTPFPVSDWRPGDGPDDTRWRGLTEIEVREVLAMLANYESLVAWGEKITATAPEFGTRASDLAVAKFPARPNTAPSHEAAEYLKDQRAQIDRFRRELRFLEKHPLEGVRQNRRLGD
jgi:hypothetical protein